MPCISWRPSHLMVHATLRFQRSTHKWRSGCQRGRCRVQGPDGYPLRKVPAASIKRLGDIPE